MFAVLCPGPSLAKCPPLDAEVTIGVNRAAAFCSCDVWAALDSPLIHSRGHEIIGRPTLFTRRQSFDSLARHGDGWGDASRAVCYAEDLSCPVARWDLYTMTAALVLAKHMGAATVNVYGCDWTDAPDWDGTAAGENRAETRWELERSIYAAVVDWLDGCGCQVFRR